MIGFPAFIFLGLFEAVIGVIIGAAKLSFLMALIS
jgi:hypothetical protein